VPAGGAQLDAGSLGETVHPELREELMGDLQLLAGVDGAAGASQPFAVEEKGPGEVKAQAGGREAVDGVAIQGLGNVAFAQQGTTSSSMAAPRPSH
jgi:hypothetical protein